MNTPADLHVALRAHRDEEMTTLKALHEKLVVATTEEKAALHAEIRSFREASRAKMMGLINNSRLQERTVRSNNV